MLDKETKRSRRTYSQTKIHTVIINGRFLYKKKEKGGGGAEAEIKTEKTDKQKDTSTHVELIIRGQERH